MNHSRIFEDLFVLELANNHWGRVERGLRIVTDFSRIVRFNNVRAAIKIQLRDVDAFIHKDFRERDDDAPDPPCAAGVVVAPPLLRKDACG